MHPKYKRKAAKANAAAVKTGGGSRTGIAEKDIQARKFPGLSMPDATWTPAETYVDSRAGKEMSDPLPPSLVEDTMAELAAVAARRNRSAAEDFLGGEPTAKRSKRNDIDERHSYGARFNGAAGAFYTDASTEYESRGSSSHSGNGYGRDHNRPGTRYDERPVLYKIYDGTVQNMRDFGAFVSLEGVQGRTEGKSSRSTVSHAYHLRHGSRLEHQRSATRVSKRGLETA